MKLVIVEGTDNTGKDTLISKLIEKYPTVTIIHCGKPYSKKYSSLEQDSLFDIYASNIINKKYDNTHLLIMNRSHIGEYVYGVLYRGRDEDDVFEMIEHIDEKIMSRSDLDVYYIQLLCSSEELLSRNEDNKSLSNGNKEKILKEKEKFEEIYSVSKLRKKLIYVNDGDNFKSRDTIFNEVWRFINE